MLILKAEFTNYEISKKAFDAYYREKKSPAIYINEHNRYGLYRNGHWQELGAKRDTEKFLEQL